MKKRFIYLDFLRIIGILLVLLNHTDYKLFFLFAMAKGKPLYWFYLFYFADPTRFTVPPVAMTIFTASNE